MNNFPTDTPPLVCDLTAIAAPERSQHLLTATQIFEAAQSLRELPDGYALQLPNEVFMALAQFVENERRCCSFFRFGLELEPEAGPLWLRLTGGEGIKDLLYSMLSVQLNSAALSQLFYTGGDAGLEAQVARAAPRIAEAFKKGLHANG